MTEDDEIQKSVNEMIDEMRNFCKPLNQYLKNLSPADKRKLEEISLKINMLLMEIPFEGAQLLCEMKYKIYCSLLKRKDSYPYVINKRAINQQTFSEFIEKNNQEEPFDMEESLSKFLNLSPSVHENMVKNNRLLETLVLEKNLMKTNTVKELMKLLSGVDPEMKVRFVIMEVNYTYGPDGKIMFLSNMDDMEVTVEEVTV